LEYVYIHENQQNVKGKLDESIRKYLELKKKLNITDEVKKEAVEEVKEK
jgi:hypothetical protein